MISFYEHSYKILRKVPKGKVTTYKEIAKALGNAHLARAVGLALNRNQTPIKIPCHRVVKSDGSVGGYKLGQNKKIELLKSEGIKIVNRKIQGFETLLMHSEGFK